MGYTYGLQSESTLALWLLFLLYILLCQHLLFGIGGRGGGEVERAGTEAALFAWLLTNNLLARLLALLDRSAVASWPDTCIEGVLFESTSDIDKAELAVNLGAAEFIPVADELYTLGFACSAIQLKLCVNLVASQCTPQFAPAYRFRDFVSEYVVNVMFHLVVLTQSVKLHIFLAFRKVQSVASRQHLTHLLVAKSVVFVAYRSPVIIHSVEDDVAVGNVHDQCVGQ